MKTKVPIKDWTGYILGFVETDEQGNKVVYDFYNRILGRYDKKQDVTKDFYGRLIAKGDQSSMLIGMNQNKK